jgi:hypothetical protein
MPAAGAHRQEHRQEQHARVDETQTECHAKGAAAGTECKGVCSMKEPHGYLLKLWRYCGVGENIIRPRQETASPTILSSTYAKTLILDAGASCHLRSKRDQTRFTAAKKREKQGCPGWASREKAWVGQTGLTLGQRRVRLRSRVSDSGRVKVLSAPMQSD